MADDGLRIIELRAENVKRLRAARVRPDGSVVVVSGPNGAGKSSLFDSITYGLGGARYEPSRPVREGAEHAEIEIDLGRFRIARKILPDRRNVLEVRSADGAKYPTPQSMIDALLGDLTFDVSEFPRKKPGEQHDILRRLAGLDLSDLDDAERRTYDQRTVEGRRLREIEARLASLPQDPGAPESEVSASDVAARLVQAREAEREAARARETLSAARAALQLARTGLDAMPEVVDAPEVQVDTDALTSSLDAARRMESDLATSDRRIASFDQEIRDLEDRLMDLRERRENAVEARRDLRERLDLTGHAGDIEQRLEEARAANRRYARARAREDQQAVLDQAQAGVLDAEESLQTWLDTVSAAGSVVEIEAELRDIESRNVRARRRAERALIEESLAEVRTIHSDLDREVERIRAERQRRIESAAMPLEGLSLGQGEVLYRGLPLEQASEAEQFRVAAAIGMALNPQLRVLLLRNGSLLDKTTMAALAEMAEEKGYQVWVERVAEPGEGVGVVIEDGEIVET